MRRHLPILLLGVTVLAACSTSEPVQPRTVIFFPHASTAMDAPAQNLVALAARQAAQNPTASVTVEGYAAANGDPDADAQLAAERARLVAALLQRDGVDANRIQVIPRPPSNELKSVGARRVEIVVGTGS